MSELNYKSVDAHDYTVEPLIKNCSPLMIKQLQEQADIMFLRAINTMIKE